MLAGLQFNKAESNSFCNISLVYFTELFPLVILKKQMS